MPKTPWICAQLGSREHYAIPRALHRAGRLRCLLTDFWHDPERASTLDRWLARGKASGRFHPELREATIVSWGRERLWLELWGRARRWSSWKLTIARNARFQKVLLSRLGQRPELHFDPQQPGVFFAFSYAALELMRAAKQAGWTTVLGQIDPAQVEEGLVAGEIRAQTEFPTAWDRAPGSYWNLWKQECALADTVMVNSPWSCEALVRQGIPESKITIVPLAYEAGRRPDTGTRIYPDTFTAETPMRVLFLGQINHRKGVPRLLQALDLVPQEKLRIHLAGPTDLTVSDSWMRHPSLEWLGPVDRPTADRLYAESHLFVLPTLSDGFALTQLEAQAHGLPLLVSRFCGSVVEHRQNGWLLEEVTPEAIATGLRYCLDHPGELAAWSNRSRVADTFSHEALQERLLELVP